MAKLMSYRGRENKRRESCDQRYEHFDSSGFSMLGSHPPIIMLFCVLGLLGGCGEKPRTEDFGEIIYKIPEPPADAEQAKPADRS